MKLLAVEPSTTPSLRPPSGFKCCQRRGKRRISSDRFSDEATRGASDRFLLSQFDVWTMYGFEDILATEVSGYGED